MSDKIGKSRRGIDSSDFKARVGAGEAATTLWGARLRSKFFIVEFGVQLGHSGKKSRISANPRKLELITTKSYACRAPPIKRRLISPVWARSGWHQ